MGRENVTSAITVVVVNGNSWPVDWQLLEVGSTVTVELGVEVREDTALEKGVVREVDSSHDVSRLEHLAESVKTPWAVN